MAKARAGDKATGKRVLALTVAVAVFGTAMVLLYNVLS